MDIYNRDNLTEFLVALYGNQAHSWEINDEVAKQVILMVLETEKCSKAMDFIPRPHPYGSNPLSWLGKEAAKGLFRHLKNNKDQYAVCASKASLVWRSKIQMASMGL